MVKDPSSGAPRAFAAPASRWVAARAASGWGKTSGADDGQEFTVGAGRVFLVSDNRGDLRVTRVTSVLFRPKPARNGSRSACGERTASSNPLLASTPFDDVDLTDRAYESDHSRPDDEVNALDSERTEIGIVCGRCDQFNPMGTVQCSCCENELSLLPRGAKPSVAPKPSTLPDRGAPSERDSSREREVASKAPSPTSNAAPSSSCSVSDRESKHGSRWHECTGRPSAAPSSLPRWR